MKPPRMTPTEALKRLVAAFSAPLTDVTRLDKLEAALEDAVEIVGGEFDLMAMEDIAAEVLVDKINRDCREGLVISVTDLDGNEDGVIVVSVEPGLSSSLRLNVTEPAVDTIN